MLKQCQSDIMLRLKDFPLRPLVRSSSTSCKNSDGGSWWTDLKMAPPPDQIQGQAEAFLHDKHPNKLNLAMGAYRDDDGKPYVLSCVRKAEEKVMAQNLNKEYPPITGETEFRKLVAGLMFGEDSEVIKKGLNATVQGVSGTGSLFIGAKFLSMIFPGKEVYLPVPTWANHKPIFNYVGFQTKTYRYYNPETKWLDSCKMLEDICSIPEKSLIVFQACAHNPSGIDPTQEEWKEISDAVKKRHLFPIFDMAYQGFATGDEERDAFAVRYFAEQGHCFLLAQSFSKNMGLYGERIGALTLLCNTKEEAEKVISQLKPIMRRVYSMGPAHGARIVQTILSDAELKKEWKCEVKGMADRIMSIRKTLVEELKKAGSKHDWGHISKQIGMFSYTGLTEEQVGKMTKEYHVYMTSDSRISIAGVTSKNVAYLAKAMHEVTKG